MFSRSLLAREGTGSACRATCRAAPPPSSRAPEGWFPSLGRRGCGARPPLLPHSPFCASVLRSSSRRRRRLGRSSEAARRVPAGSGCPGLTMPRGVAGAPGGPRASRAAGRPRRAASEPCAPASPPVPRGRPTASGGAAGPPRFLPPPPPRTASPRRRGAPGGSGGSSGAAPPSMGPPPLPPRAAPSRAPCVGLTAPDRVPRSRPWIPALVHLRPLLRAGYEYFIFSAFFSSQSRD